MNKLTLNYLHTNIVIPSFILFNFDDFKNVIAPLPQNMEIFIKEETFAKAKEKMNMSKDLQLPDIKLTGAEIEQYYVIFIEFDQSYINYDRDNYAVAIALKDDGFRYFTYEKRQNENKEQDYFVCEWEIDMEKNAITTHLNYGPTTYYGINDFGYYIEQQILQEKKQKQTKPLEKK